MPGSGWQLCLSLTAAGAHHPLPAVLQSRPHLQEVPGEALPGLWAPSPLPSRGWVPQAGPRGRPGGAVWCQGTSLPQLQRLLAGRSWVTSVVFPRVADSWMEMVSSPAGHCLDSSFLPLPVSSFSTPQRGLASWHQAGWRRLCCRETGPAIYFGSECRTVAVCAFQTSRGVIFPHLEGQDALM